MKANDTLSITANSLAIVAQLLAIGIEVGVIAGGVYVYKKFVVDEKKSTVSNTVDTENLVSVQPEPKKMTFKEKWQKVKKIAKAVIEE